MLYELPNFENKISLSKVFLPTVLNIFYSPWSFVATPAWIALSKFFYIFENITPIYANVSLFFLGGKQSRKETLKFDLIHLQPWLTNRSI